jgi:hypothetical protein|tara:strand:+ start:1567 stop:1758 length:192 start_codon:yes stop_codon:yes gene_type:complete
MSEKKKEEIIKNLTHSIKMEKEKKGQGNSETLAKLEGILESVVNDTYVSQFKKRAKRKPKVKK